MTQPRRHLTAILIGLLTTAACSGDDLGTGPTSPTTSNGGATASTGGTSNTHSAGTGGGGGTVATGGAAAHAGDAGGHGNEGAQGGATAGAGGTHTAGAGGGTATGIGDGGTAGGTSSGAGASAGGGGGDQGGSSAQGGGGGAAWLPACGDGDAHSSEACDQLDLHAQDCTDFGFTGGTLACTDACTPDTSACNDNCGNGVVDVPEVCDGSNAGSSSCLTQGFTGGTLACTSDCRSFVTDLCTSDWACHPDYYEDGQYCDCGCGIPDPDCASSSPLACHYCNTFGSCASSCSELSPHDNSKCQAYCGDGAITPPEICDPAYAPSLDRPCTGLVGRAHRGEASCAADCLSWDTTGCSESPLGCGPGEKLVRYIAESAPVTIPDGSEPPAVVPIEIPANDSRSVLSLAVVVDVAHSYDAHLDISLRTPDLTTVDLSSDNGSSGDGYVDTAFVDDAVVAIESAAAPFSGNYRPEGELSQLRGTRLGGDWHLVVDDDTAGETGTVDRVALYFCVAAQTVEVPDGCLDGLDNDPNGFQDCEESACRGGGGLCDSGYLLEDEYGNPCIEHCDGLQNCEFDIHDAFACNCRNDAGCDAFEQGFRCYVEVPTPPYSAPFCGPPCTDLGAPDAACTELLLGRATCDLDTGACVLTPVLCGDGWVGGAEECDAGDLGGQSCETIGQGFAAGHLACAADCLSFDTSGCVPGTIPLQERFDSGLLATDWYLFDVDGRTPTSEAGYATDAWVIVGNTQDYEAGSTSLYEPPGAADDWMITPAVTLPAGSDCQVEWSASASPTWGSYEVRLFHDEPTAGNLLTSDLLWSGTASNEHVTERVVSLQSYQGQTVHVAWRNTSTALWQLAIDDITIRCLDGPLGPVCEGGESCSESTRDCCAVGWCNVQWQEPMNPVPWYEETVTYYGQVWVSGLTEAPGISSFIEAEFGIGPVGEVTDPRTDARWGFIGDVLPNVQVGNNDEHMFALPLAYFFWPGEAARVAFRFRVLGAEQSDWVYCDGNGNGPQDFDYTQSWETSITSQ